MTRTSLTAVRRDLRRAFLARRRLLAAIFAALAVVATVQAARPDPGATRPVVVAATDLATGEMLDASDIETIEADSARIPDGALDPEDPPLGRTLAGPVRAGEPLTDVRLVQSELLAGYDAGAVLTTIRVFEPAAAALVEAGDEVDIVGADPRGSGAAIIASGATVVTRPQTEEAMAIGDGAPLVVAVDQATALALAEAAVRQQLTVLVV